MLLNKNNKHTLLCQAHYHTLLRTLLHFAAHCCSLTRTLLHCRTLPLVMPYTAAVRTAARHCRVRCQTML
jgi:hypothetical protein